MPDYWPSAAATAPQYRYAPELARFVLEHWPIGTAPDSQSSSPKLTTLTQFLAACYHASLMRDEERPVTFRAILSEPELIASSGRPPESLQRLLFQESLPLDASGLRRLSVAADTQRALIGVQPRGDDGLRI